MLSKLYEDGFLNYQAMILKYYKDLDLNETDAIILIKMLDLYKVSKKIRVSKLASETKIKKSIIEESLDKFHTAKIYAIEMIVNDNGLEDERTTFEPLFVKLSDLMKSEAVLKVEEQLKAVVQMLEGEILRPITPMEYSLVEGFVKKDHFQVSEIEDAIKMAVKQGKVTLSSVERLLLKKRQASLDGKKSNISEKDVKALEKALDLL